MVAMRNVKILDENENRMLFQKLRNSCVKKDFWIWSVCLDATCKTFMLFVGMLGKLRDNGGVGGGVYATYMMVALWIGIME